MAMKNDIFETVFAVVSGEVVAGATGIASIGLIKIHDILLYGSVVDFGILSMKTFLLAFFGGFGGLIAKYLWNKIKR